MIPMRGGQRQAIEGFTDLGIPANMNGTYWKEGNMIASKSTVLIASTLLAMVIAGLPAVVSGDGGDPSLIHACVKKSGALRIIGATESCKASETPIHWTIAGPAAQVCPSGQFVSGFDPAGQIICSCPSSQDTQATLAFEEEGIDLETGVVSVRPPPGQFFLPEVDFHFLFNANRPNPIVLFQDNGAEIAFLDGTPFDTVCSVVGTLTFTASLIDVPFDFDDTVVIRTAEGNVFKVGKPVNNGDVSVTFSYAKLQ